MNRTMKNAALLLLSTATFLAAGCAQDVGDINRVQANALKKSDFEGVWYFRQTVTDVPAHVDYTFIGYTSSMEKVQKLAIATARKQRQLISVSAALRDAL